MPLSWNEIRDRSLAFSREWADAESERAEAQSFWNDFFRVFGIHRRRVAIFEKQVAVSRAGEKLKDGRIDAFWKGVLLIEHKSAGANLDRAFAQAADYFEGLVERDLPRYILVSDFRNFRLFDLEAGREWKIALKDLHKHIKRFGFIAGYQAQVTREQDPVNVEAAERMGKLHDALKAGGYTGHALEVCLVRLLFCLFADDTGIFQPRESFRDYLESRTGEDGADLGMHLHQLFQVLNTPDDKRQKALDEALADFPYVNGRLFDESLPVASFDGKMRAALINCAELDWSKISPAVFGALFQSVMDEKARRNLGAHYTSEKNILKLIKPLFMDGLWEEFNKVKNNRNRLFEFHKKLRALTFFDPACGCGNFLVIAYRELRLLELEILRASLHLERDYGQRLVDIQQLININVDQFFGIEIEEFPSQIAQVALWLMDHQMNLKVSEEFGEYFARIPLKTSPHIVCGNALRIDWNDVIPKERLSFMLGNPPFVGSKFLNDEQRADTAVVFKGIKDGGVLDFVAAWYVKAAAYIAGTSIHCAFVSTNSITQGEQVGALWTWMLGLGIKIHFAHRTFRWSNEARGKAAVHCVIIGFGLQDIADKTIYEYADIKGEPHAIKVKNINPYLVDAPDVMLEKRREPICNVLSITRGSQPTDGGNLLMDEHEMLTLVKDGPNASQWIRPFAMGDEFINNIKRYCLWLVDCPPSELRQMPHVLARVEKVKQMRIASKKLPTQALAAQPTRFGELRQPKTDYLAIPRVSSERRLFIPIGFLPVTFIAGDKLQTIENATNFHFGVLSSTMHNAWMRAVSGRLESRYSYSASIVYNNFPWPVIASQSETSARQSTALNTGLPRHDVPRNDKHVVAVEARAQAVLDARAAHPNASLADLYDPLTMPANLLKAHNALDKAVDAAYGYKGAATDSARAAFLFERYQQLTSLLPALEKPKKAVKKNKK